VEHSENYSNVARWYGMRLWDETRVRNAVTHNWITEAEFTEITGKAYS